MSTTFWTYCICGLITVIGCFVIIRSVGRQTRSEKIRGVEPGQGDQLIDHGTVLGGGGGHVTVSRVTRDPQQYAKAMAPKK
ncbi:hypothetical protein M3P21_12360 [Ruegeria sp. 2012CJ41-6]|uniref:Uncharacterized protein n=1 Tax=Ruegeria spongiae TaxID=2942209 RepID=A0ABT0Q366_9RHOB|nr:hypothetical protein [Ruegeria spongiae]MCL6284319.1 hypothetical protein [Ruegeria spongiae]